MCDLLISVINHFLNRMILQVLLLFFPLSFQPLLAFRFFVDLFSELGQQKLNVKIHLFSSPHPAHHNGYTVQNIPTQFSVGEQKTLTTYETSNYCCFFFLMSPLIFTLEVVSAPKPSSVKLSISCLTASWKEPGYHIISLPKTSEVKKPPTRRRIGNSHGSHVSFIRTYRQMWSDINHIPWRPSHFGDAFMLIRRCLSKKSKSLGLPWVSVCNQTKNMPK